MILSGYKFANKLALAAILLTSAAAITPSASASAQQPAATTTVKQDLVRTFNFVGFDTTGIKFDLESDPSYAADSANYKYHLYINSQFNGAVVAFSNDTVAIHNLANAAILLYEVGQVKNVVTGATGSL
ncbi:hypothetical protein [Granulicella arctica]|uniref:hypothetical protein n=1 Tax=Granulicella arctica TaxID=940613 RepID=UPI0021E0E2F2|nr:hypothetical protein [Granulicella arctica]